MRAVQAEAYPQRERAVRLLLSERFRSYQDTGASLDVKVSGGWLPVRVGRWLGGLAQCGVGRWCLWRWQGRAGRKGGHYHVRALLLLPD